LSVLKYDFAFNFRMNFSMNRKSQPIYERAPLAFLLRRSKAVNSSRE
jgi:hypothetical protein